MSKKAICGVCAKNAAVDSVTVEGKTLMFCKKCEGRVKSAIAAMDPLGSSPPSYTDQPGPSARSHNLGEYGAGRQATFGMEGLPLAPPWKY